MFPVIFISLVVAAPSQAQYRFIPDSKELVGFIRGNALYTGHLDEKGEFHQTGRQESGALGIFVLRGPGFRHLDSFPKYPAAVYEFRSGVLVPGEMTATGHFVPEVGGKIIRFADYKYSPSAMKIWNLPGRFEVVEDKKADDKK